jgi:TonB family protein
MQKGLRSIETALKPKPMPLTAPTLLVQLEPWHRIFFHNLRDVLWPHRLPALELRSAPADFWGDVFVHSRLPWTKFGQSALFHAAVILVLWGSARLWPSRPHLVAPVPFHSSDVVYYQASDYLPPLDTGGAKKVAVKGDPAYSPQPIISVPPEADNRRQTIVSPPKLKLEHDVPLPNVVAWNHPQPAVPLAAATRRTSDVQMPSVSTAVIAPPPEVDQHKLNRSSLMTESPVAPAPDIDPAISKHALPATQAAVIEPPPNMQVASTRKLSDINIGHAQVVAPAPQLPVEEQHALSSRSEGSLGNPGATVVPPPPSMSGAAVGSQDGRLIALSLQPASPSGPVEVPQGNRRGTFAATPEGKPGASGTPNITGGNERANGAGPGSGAGNASGIGSGHTANGIPPGLFVGASPAGSTISAVGGTGAGANASGNGGGNLMASARDPQPGSVPRKLASEIPPDQESDVERKVFASRKSYSMTLNLPNLNSAGGSWVMHFSELQDEKQSGDLLAPVATHAVDPGYPLELMRENVKGTVTLVAVIHSDGSVGDVQVLNGIDDRLDEYARNALLRWRFLPAMRNGNPVALQAVVIIPFRPRQKVGF